MVKIQFDGSGGERDHGACFEIVVRNQEHARQIAAWLRKVCVSNPDWPPSIRASQELEPQMVIIEV